MEKITVSTFTILFKYRKMNADKYLKIASIFIFLYCLSEILNWAIEIKGIFVVLFTIPSILAYRIKKNEKK